MLSRSVSLINRQGINVARSSLNSQVRRTLLQSVGSQSTRTFASSTYEKYRDILEQLGLQKTGNKGVFDGEWKGNGELIASLNPVNNQVIAEVVQVSLR